MAEQFEVPVLEDHGRPEAPRRSAASRLLFLLLASLVAVTAAVTEPRTSAAHRQAPPWTASADAACEAAAAGLRIGVPSSRADYRVLESSRLRLQRQFFRNLATLVPPQRRAWLQREVVAPRVRRIARELYALKAFGPGDLQEFRRRMRLARANEIENDLLVSSVGLKHCAALG